MTRPFMHRLALAWLHLQALGGCSASHAGEDGQDGRDAESSDAVVMPDAGVFDDAALRADSAVGGADATRSQPRLLLAEDAGPPDRGQPQVRAWLGATRQPTLRSCAFDGAMDGGDSVNGRVLLLLQLDASGQLQAASVTFGRGPSLPPVEDADAYYPPDPPWGSEVWQLWFCPYSGLWPGFEYTLRGARFDGQRLQGRVEPPEVARAWCQLQHSYQASELAAKQWGDYLCLPTDHIDTLDELNFEFSAEPSVEHMCLKTHAACACDAQGCTSARGNSLELDLVVTSSGLEGRITTGFGVTELRLERIE